MKLADTIASAIVVAAVLVSAYAAGLLIREARTGDLSSEPQAVADSNDRAIRPPVAALAGGPAEAMKNVPEQVAKPEESPQSAVGPNSLPQRRKEPFKPGAGGPRGGKGPQALSPQQRERMHQKLEGMSDKQRQSPRARPQSRSEVGRQQRSSDASKGDVDTGKDSDRDGSMPDESDQG